jgi:hypothetical protein
MKSHISQGIVLLILIAVAGCATGPNTGRNIKVGDMLPGEIISLKDGTKLTYEIQFTSSSQGRGIMKAFNPASNESFQGQYRVILTGGGSSTGVVRDSWGWTAGTVTTTSDPKAAARGFLKGDKGTVIDISIDLTPVKSNAQDGVFFFFSGQGTGTDNNNNNNRYQVYFGY